MTREGYSKIESELNSIKQNELKECLQALSDAREKGDLSENAEYDAAKQTLDELQVKMTKMSAQLSNAQIIDTIIDNGTVQMLTYVKFKNLKTGVESEYRIVPENETDLKNKKISQNSPIGSALMEKKIGDRVNVDVPAGKLELEILNIRIS